MNIFGGLLFLQGHVASTELARQLASPPTPARSARSNRLRLFSRREPVERSSPCVPALDVFRQPRDRIDIQCPTTVEGVTQRALAGATGQPQAFLLRKLHRSPVVQPVHAQAQGGPQPRLQWIAAIALFAQRDNCTRQGLVGTTYPFGAASSLVLDRHRRRRAVRLERRTQLQLQVSRIALAFRFHQCTGVEVEELEPTPVQCADASERIT